MIYPKAPLHDGVAFRGFCFILTEYWHIPHAHLQIAFPNFTATIIKNIICKKDSFMVLFVKIFY